MKSFHKCRFYSYVTVGIELHHTPSMSYDTIIYLFSTSVTCQLHLNCVSRFHDRFNLFIRSNLETKFQNFVPIVNLISVENNIRVCAIFVCVFPTLNKSSIVL